MAAWAKKVTGTCYICDHYRDAYGRYIETFFDMFRKNGEFKELFKNSKGFCIPHFADLAEAGERLLSDKDKKEFFEILIPMMQENLHRIYEDLDWFCDKFDYRIRTRTGRLPRMPCKEECKRPAAVIRRIRPM